MFRNIKYLAIGGGGAAGIALGGALEELRKIPDFSFDRIEAVAATSVGNIPALAICLKFSNEEMQQTLGSLNLKAFKDGGWTAQQAHSLFTKYGIYKGRALVTLLQEFFKRRELSNRITFRELHDKGYKDLYVVTTKLFKINDKPTGKEFIFSPEKTPDTAVMDAILASCAAPIYFRRVRLKKEAKGKYVENPEGDIFMDGGLHNNLPFNVFDQGKFGGIVIDTKSGEIYNPHALGLALTSRSHKEDPSVKAKKSRILDNAPIEAGVAVVNTIFIKLERDSVHHPKNKDRVIKIDRGNINLGDFDITDAERQALIEAGRVGVRKFAKKLEQQAQTPKRHSPFFTVNPENKASQKHAEVELSEFKPATKLKRRASY